MCKHIKYSGCRAFSYCLFSFVCAFQKQLFGIEAPASSELTGLRKYFNSYTLQGRRNVRNTHKYTAQAAFNMNFFKFLHIKSLSQKCVLLLSLAVCLGYLWGLCSNSSSLLDAPTTQKRKPGVQLHGLKHQTLFSLMINYNMKKPKGTM